MKGDECNEDEKASQIIIALGKPPHNSTLKQKLSSSKKIRSCLAEYCGRTSIHGMQYLGEKQRPLLERLCWLLAIMLSLAFCGYQIQQLWDKWDRHPVIVTLSEESTPVWKVPFPAITVCSDVKAKRSEVNYTHLLEKYDNNDTMTEEELSQLEKMSLLCGDTYKEGDMTINSSVLQYFEEVGYALNETLFGVMWRDDDVQNISTMFSPLITEEGICFTFNMLDSDDIFTDKYDNDGDFLKYGFQSSPRWTLDKGYAKNAGVETYPHRALGTGAVAGLQLILAIKADDLDRKCTGPVEGFKILLHNPADIPDVREKYLLVPLNQQFVISVIPRMMVTSKGIRKYSPHRRQCYFPSERQLHFYKVYTENNCQLECLSNFTLQKCNCVAFYMPRDSNMPICGPAKTECVSQARYMMMVEEIKKNIDHEEDNYDESSSQCDCLQACTVLSYDAETSQAEINMQDYIYDPDLKGVKITAVTIFFKDSQFIASRRNELYGTTDFLANCGGLLGLFMGFSVLSLIEIIYHLTLRMYCLHSNKRELEKQDAVPV